MRQQTYYLMVIKAVALAISMPAVCWGASVELSPNDYIDPELIDGVCHVISPPKSDETPIHFAARHQEFWTVRNIDIDCMRKYYSSERLYDYRARGDFVAMFVTGVTSYNFLTYPCSSSFRKELDIFLSDHDVIKNNKYWAQQPRNAIFFLGDLYYVAGRIEEKCGNDKGKIDYFQQGAGISGGPIGFWERTELEVSVSPEP